jgi:hypothetical protein
MFCAAMAGNVTVWASSRTTKPRLTLGAAAY